jgi:hypothetical protein
LGLPVTILIGRVDLWFHSGGSVRIDTSRPAVVHRIQQLQRLETVVFGMDKIVTGGQESRYFPKLLVGERLLLIVYGEVTAGVDLSKIESGQIDVNGKNIVMTLPAPEILHGTHRQRTDARLFAGNRPLHAARSQPRVGYAQGSGTTDPAGRARRQDSADRRGERAEHADDVLAGPGLRDTPRSAERRPYVLLVGTSLVFLIGSSRTRMPHAAKIAFATRGPTPGTHGSPRPPIRRARLHELNGDERCVGDLDHPVVAEISLDHLPSANRDLAEQRRPTSRR